MDSSAQAKLGWFLVLIAYNAFVRNAVKNGPAVIHRQIVRQLAMETMICKCIPMQPVRNANTIIFWSVVDVCI